MQLLEERLRIAPNWRRLHIGGATLTIICDGVATFDDLPALVGAEAAGDEVARLTVRAFLDPRRLHLSLNVLVVETGRDLVVFDAGIGELGRDLGCGRLSASLQDSGIAPEAVTVVCLTHLHADHIAGLLEGGVPLFPNARYVVGRQEYDYWTSSAARADPRPETIELVQRYVTPLRSRMTLVDDGEPVTPDIVPRAAFGHSAGHMMFEVQAVGSPLLVVGDVLPHALFAVERPRWPLAFDADPQRAAETRVRVLDELAEHRIPLFAFHLPLPGVGYVGRRNQGYEFIPATHQLL